MPSKIVKALSDDPLIEGKMLVEALIGMFNKDDDIPKPVGLIRRYLQDAVDDIASISLSSKETVKQFGDSIIKMRAPAKWKGPIHASSDPYIARRVFKRDRYLEDRIGEGDTVVVANAVNGPAAVKASMQVGPNGRVITYEPASNNYPWLEENLRLNKAENVETYQLAIHGEAGKMNIRINDVNTGAQGPGPETAGFTSTYEGRKKQKSETVRTTTLSDVWDKNHVDESTGKVHLILDNEYSDGDPRVLREITQLKPDTIAMEVHMNQGLKPDYDKVVGTLEAAGYKVNHLSGKFYRKFAKQGLIYAEKIDAATR